MASKTNILFLGLVLALLFLVSSQVAARDLEEASNKSEESENTNVAGVNDAKYPGGGYGGYPGGGYGGYPGGGYGGYPGRGGYGGYPGRGGYGGYPGRGGYCRFGCCGQSYYGGGRCRCCAYPGQNVDSEPQN